MYAREKRLMESMFVAEYEGKIMGNDRGYCKRRKELYDRERGE